MTTLERSRRIALRARSRILVAARPSWASGAARLLDLGGAFDSFALQVTPHKTDAEAIADDWAAVGADLTSAMQASIRQVK